MLSAASIGVVKGYIHRKSSESLVTLVEMKRSDRA
jgi:hypothetical protein